MHTNGKLKVGRVYSSVAGNLKCTKVIHAVGPRWFGGNRNEDNDLYDTVYACLDEACKLGLTSIGLPAISAGIFGFPIKKSAETTVEAVDSFFKESLDNRTKISLKAVYLVNHVLKDAQIFVQALQHVYKEKVIITGNLKEDNVQPVGTYMSKIKTFMSLTFFII